MRGATTSVIFSGGNIATLKVKVRRQVRIFLTNSLPLEFPLCRNFRASSYAKKSFAGDDF